MTFLRNQWYVAATGAEVETGPFARKICNEPVVLFRRGDGSVAALEDRCPHRRAPLSAGTVVGDDIQCGYHGARFDGTGACTGIPSQRAIPGRGFGARAYPVIERYNLIFIWTGDPALADPDLLPDMSMLDEPGSEGAFGYHYMECNYQLLVDNLLDLTHLPYLHPGTLARVARDGWFEHQDVKVEGDRVRTFRAMRNEEQTPFVVMTKAFEGAGKLDRFQESTFQAPGYVVISLAFDRAGSGREEMPEIHHQVPNCITPETESTTHYFWAATRRFALGDEEITQKFYQLTKNAFDEDQAMLRKQQAVLDEEDWRAPLVNFAGDAASVAARRVIAAKLDEEHKIAAVA